MTFLVQSHNLAVNDRFLRIECGFYFRELAA
jgi:hypothetical protein